MPHSWSLDHAGPLTQSVADAALLLNVLAGHDANDPGSADRPVPDYVTALDQPVAGLRIGVCRNHFFRAQRDRCRGGGRTSYQRVREGRFGDQGGRHPQFTLWLGAIFAIELASSTAYHDRSLQAGRTAHYQADVRTLVEIGRFVTGPDYLKAEQFRRVLIEDFRRVFAEIDLLIAPTTPLTAWKVGERTVSIGGSEESVLAASWRLTYPFNLTGLPAISLPCGFDRRGLPIGLQLAGKPFEEATVLTAADAYERLHEWRHHLPNL